MSNDPNHSLTCQFPWKQCTCEYKPIEVKSTFTISTGASEDVAKGKGTKDDAGKVDPTLYDPEFYLLQCQVMMMGAKKYKRGNWQLSLEPLRILGALIRHTFAILKGEWIDKESGLPHTAHIGCNAMFLDYYRRRGDPLGTEHGKI